MAEPVTELLTEPQAGLEQAELMVGLQQAELQQTLLPPGVLSALALSQHFHSPPTLEYPSKIVHSHFSY